MALVDNTPEEEAFAQHVLDLDARFREGKVTEDELIAAWSVFADLLEERLGPHHNRCKALRRFPRPIYSTAVLTLTLGYCTILAGAWPRVISFSGPW